jgi:integrase
MNEKNKKKKDTPTLYNKKKVVEDKCRLYKDVSEISQIKKPKMYGNYKPYHLPTYSSLSVVENYRFVVDILNLLKEARSRMVFTTHNMVNVEKILAIFSISYLTGSRASEVAEIKLSDVMFYRNESNKWFVRVKLVNRKNKKEMVKNVIFSYDFNKTEHRIFRYFLKWWIRCIKPISNKYGVSWKKIITKSDKIPKDLRLKIENYTNNRYVFSHIRKTKEGYYKLLNKKSISRNSIHIYFTKHLGHNSHFFRKVRATHLYSIYGFKLKQLQKYLGHSDVRSSTPYTYIDSVGMEKNFLETLGR